MEALDVLNATKRAIDCREKIDWQSFPNPKPEPKPKRQKRPIQRERKSKPQWVDMSGLPLGKINRSQRVDRQVRKDVHKPICEIPGCGRPTQKGPHHVTKRSKILIDHRLNLISLCDEHHDKADRYEIAQVDLYELIADREKVTVEELLMILGNHAGVLLYIDGERVRVRE